jgi:hypothetical protein
LKKTLQNPCIVYPKTVPKSVPKLPFKHLITPILVSATY